MSEPDDSVQFIPAEQYEREMGALQAGVTEGGVTGPVERIGNRRSVVNSFLSAFEMIGGVPALAVWGAEDENRGDFYRMYARMAPSAAHDKGTDEETKVIHVIPPSALDE